MAQAHVVETAQPTFNHALTDELTITPDAHAQLKALVDSEEDIEGLRIFVAGGGCAGMTYSMTFATERHDHDTVLEQGGLRVFVDAVALNFLDGVEIDFAEQQGNPSFVFRNVFQAIGGGGTCGGCGNAMG